jgi:hypothetical protein
MKNEIILFIGLIILLIGYFAYRYFFTAEKFEKLDDTPKIIQYFGGDYCPFSNTDSNAYKVIKEFEDAYGNKVSVKYYWVGKDDSIMKELDVKYVPTILNGDNKQVELDLPKGTDTTKLSSDELKNILFENIYNKL